MNKIPQLAIVIPCFNEEQILSITIVSLKELLDDLCKRKVISHESFLCFVDDGSNDGTWKILTESSKERNLKAIKLSNNFGHQNALIAGLFENKNKADIFITIDADLQDNINIIESMILSYNRGNQLVYGVRDSRKNDSLFKRQSASIFYWLQNKLGVKIIKHHADFRLISNNILSHLEKFEEVNLFLRAIFPLIGFKSEKIYYERKPRIAGYTKYPLKKMISFAWDGITSFSTFPLRLISILGGLIFILSIIVGLFLFYLKIFKDGLVPGWASTVIPIYFIGGIQLLSIGIIGEYVGKIYKETKRRPKYIIEKKIE